MSFIIKKLLLSFFFNISLFILLIIGIQNSSNKSKVDLLLEESVKLPIGFIVGTSFITGSICGSFLNIINNKNN